jgi:hypothetical protein
MVAPGGARRLFLGRRRGFSGQQRTYRTPDYIEIDDVEGYDVTRRRIFYDEILLVTLHTTVAWLLAIGVGTLGGVLGLACLPLISESKGAGALLFLCTAAPLLALAVLLLARPFGVVTVFGKRTRTQMEFWWRKGRARETYLLVCRLARERQSQLARPAPQTVVPSEMAPTVPLA